MVIICSLTKLAGFKFCAFMLVLVQTISSKLKPSKLETNEFITSFSLHSLVWVYVYVATV
jgi:hypothetical protein